MDNQGDVREFLAGRRARITLRQAGLPDFGGTRRVAGVSPDYYTHLERGNLSGLLDAMTDAPAFVRNGRPCTRHR
ncbi:hypothetical protein [Dactylosporangium sp. NPDC049140]|uniref:hypothetical protein n=1 Tax=Dactylosporangium sp. NPDC049140 TaxID=3155647 RepID=UPI003405432E